MEQSTAQRRLVKSPPELWAEVSSEGPLGRRLSEFGEIRITRVEPETTVAWEGDRASGTVQLEPAGWGTKVILTATRLAGPEPVPPPPEPEPIAPDRAPAPAPAPPRRGFFARLLRRRPKPAPALEIPAPPAAPPPDVAPAPARVRPPLDAERTVAILTEVLDDLGAAHHRPFSRD